MLGQGHLSACVPGTSTPRGLPRLPGGGVGEGRLALGVELTTSSAQLRDPRRSDRPRLPQTPEPPPHAACTSAGACCRQAEVGLQLGAGNMTRTQGFRARGQFTLRAPRTAQPRHSGQGPDGPVGEAAHHSGCEEPPDQASPAGPWRHRNGRSCSPTARGLGGSCWRSTQAQALPPATSRPRRRVWAGPRRPGQAGARAQPGRRGPATPGWEKPTPGQSQRGHPGGAHEAPAGTVTVIFGKRGCSPYSSCGVGPSARAHLPVVPLLVAWLGLSGPPRLAPRRALGRFCKPRQTARNKAPPPARTPGTP